MNGYDESYNTVRKSYTSDNYIDAAYTTTEKAKIVSSNVPAHANSIYSTSPGVATTDKFFLLSITEAQNYFTSNADSQADATRYAVKKGAYVLGSESEKRTSNKTCTDVHHSSNWWLWSPGLRDNYAAEVQYDGFVDIASLEVYFNDVAVRPALWVELE